MHEGTPPITLKVYCRLTSSMDSRILGFVLASIVLTSGCTGFVSSNQKTETGSLEAEVLESPPQNESAIDYGSKEIQDMPILKQVIKEAYESGNGRAYVDLNASEYPTVSENYHSLSTDYFNINGTIVRVILATEQKD